jgi:hypothetical protein
MEIRTGIDRTRRTCDGRPVGPARSRDDQGGYLATERFSSHR